MIMSINLYIYISTYLYRYPYVYIHTYIYASYVSFGYMALPYAARMPLKLGATGVRPDSFEVITGAWAVAEAPPAALADSEP